MRLLRSKCIHWCQPCLAFVVTLMCTANSLGTMILEYRFNGSGTEAAGSGTTAIALPMTRWDGATWVSADNHTASGTGASGISGDSAYRDPSLVLDPAQTPGTANSHFFGGYAGNLDVVEIKTLSAITVQGWFKVDAGKPLGTDGTAQALIGNLGSSANDGGWAIRGLRTSTAGGMEFRFGELLSSLDHASVMAPTGTYSETDEWVMFAVTFDATTGVWEFFKGKAGSPMASVASGTAGPLNGGAFTASNANFYIGNLGSESGSFLQARAFNGFLDNMRVFDNVLELSQLEQFRVADLANVPEPSTAFAATLAALIFVWGHGRPAVRRR